MRKFRQVSEKNFRDISLRNWLSWKHFLKLKNTILTHKIVPKQIVYA